MGSASGRGVCLRGVCIRGGGWEDPPGLLGGTDPLRTRKPGVRILLEGFFLYISPLRERPSIHGLKDHLHWRLAELLQLRLRFSLGTAMPIAKMGPERISETISILQYKKKILQKKSSNQSQSLITGVNFPQEIFPFKRNCTISLYLVSC